MKIKNLFPQLFSIRRLDPAADAHRIHELFFAGLKKHHKSHSSATSASAKTLVLAKTISTHKFIR